MIAAANDNGANQPRSSIIEPKRKPGTTTMLGDVSDTRPEGAPAREKVNALLREIVRRPTRNVDD